MAIIFDEEFQSVQGIAPYVPPEGISPPYHHLSMFANNDEAYFRFPQPIIIENVLINFTHASFADALWVEVFQKQDLNPTKNNFIQFYLRQFSDFFIRPSLARSLFNAREESDAGLTWPLKLNPGSFLKMTWITGPGGPGNFIQFQPMIIGSFKVDLAG